MRQTEHVLYITLIDFLLQILFFGIVVSVIYAVAQREETRNLDPEQARDTVERIRNLTGISDLTILTDELTRLGPLQPAVMHAKLGREMEKDISEAGGAESARKILAEQNARRGQGKPSCLDGGAKLATFHAYPDRIELRHPLTGEMEKLLSRMGLTPSRVARLALSEFRTTFEPVKQLEPDCRYNIELVEHSFDTRPRDAARSVFITMWLPPAPDRK